MPVIDLNIDTEQISTNSFTYGLLSFYNPTRIRRFRFFFYVNAVLSSVQYLVLTHLWVLDRSDSLF